jgi:hypothetical protein
LQLRARAARFMFMWKNRPRSFATNISR